MARDALGNKQQNAVQNGKLGVDLSVQTNNLRNQSRLEYTAQRNVGGRNCMEIGGVWIDDGFDPKMPVVAIKAQSDAYFRLLERQGQMKEVFQLGNHVLWVTPNKTALVIDTAEGKESLNDEEIDKLFVAGK
jgi:Ca-activated chloride channel family protein